MFAIAAFFDRRLRLRSGGERVMPAPVARVEVLPRSKPSGAGTPFSRFRERLPGLAPRSGSMDDYRLWLAENDLGEDPDGYWYDDLCAIAGWCRESAEAPPIAGIAPVAPIEAPVAEIATEVEPDDDEPELDLVRTPVAMPTRSKLEASVAAARFVEWVRLADRCGTYSSREFTDLCTEFFEAEDLVPLHDNVLRPALEAMRDDVMKARSDQSLRHGNRRGRQRHFKWTILEAAAETVLPWEELPRRAA